jgi:hypothetical protein
MYFPHGICAAIDGFVFVPDFLAQMWVWTDTGLYVGKVYHDPHDRIMDANSIFIELVGGHAEFRRHRPTARIEVRVPPRRRRLHA